MDYFAQQLINGLSLGSIYALITLGYTMVYGIMELDQLSRTARCSCSVPCSVAIIPRRMDRGRDSSSTVSWVWLGGHG